MGNDDKVLSQAEIDALLASSAPSTPAVKAPSSPPTQQVKISAAPPPSKVVAQQIKVPMPPPAPPKAAAPAKAATTPAAPTAAVHAPAPIPVHTPAPAPAPQTIIQQGPTPEQVTSLCKQVIAEETRELSKQVIELTIKAKKLDEVNQRIFQMEEKISEIAELVKSSPKAVRGLSTRIDEIYSLMENMHQEKRGSDEEHIHDQFHCVKCNSEKLVAIHVKCTSCGTENWMGWFPNNRENVHEHY